MAPAVASEPFLAKRTISAQGTISTIASATTVSIGCGNEKMVRSSIFHPIGVEGVDELASEVIFAHENVALYIESVYDAHFTLAQVGRKLHDGYRELGGPQAFGPALAPAEVSALERAYSEASDRLHPHGGVRLGA